MRKPEPSIGRSRRTSTATLTVPLIVLIAGMLQGCQTPMPPSEARAPLPANLTQPCPDLTPLETATGAAVLRKIVETAELYYECQARHRALVDALR